MNLDRLEDFMTRFGGEAAQTLDVLREIMNAQQREVQRYREMLTFKLTPEERAVLTVECQRAEARLATISLLCLERCDAFGELIKVFRLVPEIR